MFFPIENIKGGLNWPRHVGLLKKSIIESSNEVIFDTFSTSPSDSLNTSLARGEIAFCCRLRMRPSTLVICSSLLKFIYWQRGKHNCNSLQCFPARCYFKKASLLVFFV